MNKSAEMADNDPHGVIITIVSIGVVFAALILLYFAYTIVGKVVKSKDKRATQNVESLEHKDDTVHDKESYVVTIRRNHTQDNGIDATATHHAAGHTSTPSLGNSHKPMSKAKNISAPLPGVILAIRVNVGDEVTEGQTVAILEAMKMENEIQAECNGKVQSINVSKGDSVLEGTVIVTIG